MPTPKRLYFETFELDLQNARLFRDNQLMPLSPKAFDVLAFFCQHPGRLLSKEVLLDAVWHRRYVSEGVLKNAVQELRRVLGDDSKSPRYIETVHRRGYRFLSPLRGQVIPGDPTNGITPPPHEPGDTNIVVGRDDVLGQLHGRLGLCRSGQLQIVFLSGEAGIGKTALMRRFSAAAPEGVVFAGGQCIEQYGEVEPYLPLLECLNQLGRVHGRALTEALLRYAPTWLAQLPWLLHEGDRNAMQIEAQGLTKERMGRELGAFLDYWTHDQPHTLVLLLEDLHWSDYATLDAITYLARRQSPSRWMILGSYRPVDVIMNEHPLRLAIGELNLHRLCHDIALPLLPEAAVIRYLEHRFEGNALSCRLMQAISRRTEGLPLYLVHLSNELMVWLEQHPQRTDQEIEVFFEALPENLKLFIGQQFSRLPAETQVLLDAAAVAGSGFSPVMLAAVTGGEVLAAEAWCERLASSRHILVCPSCAYYPERRGSRRYAFIHAYYQKLAYERVPPLRRAGLHLAVAEWFEAACGARARNLAAEIATHFESGHNYERALHYYRIAVENALGKHDPHAVSALSRRALAILEHQLPATPEYARVAVELYTILAGAMQMTHGFAEPALQPVFERLLHHEQALDESPHRLPILWLMIGFYFVCGQLRTAEQYAERMLAANPGIVPLDSLISGHVGKMGVGLYAGHLDFALEHFQASQSLYRPELRGMFPLAAIHPIVLSLYFSAKTHCLLGFPDQALNYIAQGIAVAEADAQPFSLAFIQWGEIVCRQLRGEAELTEAACRVFINHADEQGFALLSAGAVIQRGWALTILGRIEEGVDAIERGLVLYWATGAHLSETFLLVYCVEAFLLSGLPEKCSNLLEKAFQIMESNGERYFEAELHRLKGETLRTSDPAEAGRHFQQAIETAQFQGARFLELRAANSLAKLWLGQSRLKLARTLLEKTYSALTEGFDTRDSLEARTLLAAMTNGSLLDS